MNKFVPIFISIFLSINYVIAASLDYNYSSTDCIPIKLAITKEISTKEGIIEGEKIEFKVLETAKYNEKTIVKKDDIVTARVETIITAGMNGFPAEIIVGNFNIPGVTASKAVTSEFSKIGQNRCLWVYPLKWALTPIPPTGSLTNLIYGGHAHIKPSDTATVYYYPNWK